jgi:uncharacterized membrane protein YhaH (DUF805 family)
MDWKNLFLSVEGRIGQKDFWIGIGLLFVSGLIIRQIPFIEWLWSLASIYFGVCVSGKRLHDIGKSAWLVLIPVGIVAVSMVLATVIGGAALLGGAATGSDTMAAAGGLAGLGLASLIMLIGAVGCLGLVIWLGTRSGDATNNQFGPPRDVSLVTMI